MIRLLTRWFARDASFTEASARDAQAIAALHAEAFRRGWSEDEVEQLLLDRSVLAHRVTSRGRVCGFIMSRIAADEAEILSIAIARAQRGRRLAERLLRLHLGRLTGQGIDAVFLEVDRDNTSARRLYERAGFYEVGRREGYYRNEAGVSSAALVLRRDLG
jgi:ribosomal-protein-alanine N-acetyltransferase